MEIYDDGDRLVLTANCVLLNGYKTVTVFLSYKKFGLSQNSTPKEILERWANLTLKELEEIAYHPLSINFAK